MTAFHMYISSIMEENNLHILRGAITYCLPTFNWINTGREKSYNLWLVTEGRGNIRFGGSDYTLASGDCFLLRMWEKSRATNLPESPLVVYWIVFDGVPEASMPRRHRHLRAMTFVEELIKRSIKEFNRAGRSCEKSTYWLQAALRVLDEEDAMPSLFKQDVKQRQLILDLCERLRRNPQINYKIEDLAAEHHYSAGHFTRIFEKHAGMSPREYLTHSRIEAARGLLCISSQKLSEIAESLGFFDQFHFSRQFKKYVGVSPSDYRKNIECNM